MRINVKKRTEDTENTAQNPPFLIMVPGGWVTRSIHDIRHQTRFFYLNKIKNRPGIDEASYASVLRKVFSRLIYRFLQDKAYSRYLLSVVVMSMSLTASVKHFFKILQRVFSKTRIPWGRTVYRIAILGIYFSIGLYVFVKQCYYSCLLFMQRFGWTTMGLNEIQ